jgi:hypothetical protein
MSVSVRKCVPVGGMCGVFGVLCGHDVPIYVRIVSGSGCRRGLLGDYW